MELQLVIFDLDGTLLVQTLDFDAMRDEMNLPDGVTILEGMAALASADRLRVERILDRHEDEGAASSELMPGATEILSWLRKRDLRVACLTRNTRRSVEIACRRHDLAFDAVVARDDGPEPKPSPEGVHHLMEACNAVAAETIMVGDFHLDITAGVDAGCRTIALVPDPPPAWADEATWVANDLARVRDILGEIMEA